jgi:CBS domain-containing protein
MQPEITLYFRDQLRQAREVVLRDAEAYLEIVHVIERLGSLLPPQPGEKGMPGLKRYQDRLVLLCSRSVLHDIGRPWHAELGGLYESVRVARNDAVHQGAFARHLAANSVRLAIILEDALLSELKDGNGGADPVEHYMVRSPVCASMWQPISFIRQVMLENSFSYLPVFDDASRLWKLIADYEIVLYLSCRVGGIAPDDSTKKSRMRATLKDADTGLGDGAKLVLDGAPICSPGTDRSDVARNSSGRPTLVVLDACPDDLMGIVTPFDLL